MVKPPKAAKAAQEVKFMPPRGHCPSSGWGGRTCLQAWVTVAQPAVQGWS